MTCISCKDKELAPPNSDNTVYLKCAKCERPLNKVKTQRTLSQNKALHLAFEQLADELNAQGKDMRVLLKPEVAIPWDKDRIKSAIWKPIQKAMFGTESTTLLTTDQVDKVFAIIQKHLGEEHGVEIHFPSIETMMQTEWYNDQE